MKYESWATMRDAETNRRCFAGELKGIIEWCFDDGSAIIGEGNFPATDHRETRKKLRRSLLFGQDASISIICMRLLREHVEHFGKPTFAK